mgnify:CR=1 FL=1
MASAAIRMAAAKSTGTRRTFATSRVTRGRQELLEEARHVDPDQDERGGQTANSASTLPTPS